MTQKAKRFALSCAAGIRSMLDRSAANNIADHDGRQFRALMNPFNPHTNNFYSGGNRIALALWNAERMATGLAVDPRFLPAEHVTALSARLGKRVYLRGGAKAIDILRPFQTEKMVKGSLDDLTLDQLADGADPEPRLQRVVAVRNYCVFNGTQVAGLGAFVARQGATAEPRELLDFVRHMGVAVDINAARDGSYDRESDLISLVPMERRAHASEFGFDVLRQAFHASGHGARGARAGATLDLDDGDPRQVAEVLGGVVFGAVGLQIAGIRPALGGMADRLSEWVRKGHDTALHEAFVLALPMVDALSAHLAGKQPRLDWWPRQSAGPAVSAGVRLSVLGAADASVVRAATEAAVQVLEAEGVSAAEGLAAEHAAMLGGECDTTALRAWSEARNAAQRVLQDRGVTSSARLDVGSEPMPVAATPKPQLRAAEFLGDWHGLG